MSTGSLIGSDLLHPLAAFVNSPVGMSIHQERRERFTLGRGFRPGVHGSHWQESTLKLQILIKKQGPSRQVWLSLPFDNACSMSYQWNQ
ncbi:hypothetical protein ACLB2K_072156 [Fragaria x ananassa]